MAHAMPPMPWRRQCDCASSSRRLLRHESLSLPARDAHSDQGLRDQRGCDGGPQAGEGEGQAVNDEAPPIWTVDGASSDNCRSDSRRSHLFKRSSESGWNTRAIASNSTLSHHHTKYFSAQILPSPDRRPSRRPRRRATAPRRPPRPRPRCW